MVEKYKVLICDDSKNERFRFYQRQFDNFEIYGVSKKNGKFYEYDPMDSVEKLYKTIIELKKNKNLPDLILLDLFYLKEIESAKESEEIFVKKINIFKTQFIELKKEVNEYLVASGVDLLKRIRIDDNISSQELPVSAYTDKNFNFLTATDFNTLYELAPNFVYKDRDDDDPRSQITATSEYFRILRIIDEAKKKKEKNKIFITHGQSPDWMIIQRYLETDLKYQTIELSQQANKGRTIINKLKEESENCFFAVIVMTGDDIDKDGNMKTRENVMHEIGFFQGMLGLDKVCILYEEGTNVPSNLSGIVYVSYPKGYIHASYEGLKKELGVT